MNEKKSNRNRKCSAILAAGAGAAICLTGGSDALATSGLVSVSNGGNSTFGISASANTVSFAQTFSLFGAKVNLRLVAAAVPAVPLYLATIRSISVGAIANTGGYGGPMIHFASGVTVSGGLGTFLSSVGVVGGQSDNYIAVLFQDAGFKFGWVHVVSTNAVGTQIRMDTWSYNSSGGSIKTLSESVTTSRLTLTDGKEKLHWTNENEDGVARYEVQSKDASGNWQTADSDVPGNGTYSAKVAAGATSRLVIEMTDGTTKEIDF